MSGLSGGLVWVARLITEEKAFFLFLLFNARFDGTAAGSGRVGGERD